MAQSSWVLDPNDPRAPSEDVWSQLTPAERSRVVASLPSSMPLDLHPPEGDSHRKPKDGARDALDKFFKSIGRRIYVSTELVTYYPNERRFCPDILAVLDVDPHDRESWIVNREGKGLDLVIEVLVGGSERKDLEDNVIRYARLGIPEYFVFDKPRERIIGYRLRGNSYERIIPQTGRLASTILGLELVVERGMLRFYHGTAALPFMDELVDKLNAMVSDLVESRDAAMRRADEEARRADEEARRADEEARRAQEAAQRATDEARRADAAEAEVERLRSELERLRAGR